MPQCAPQDGHSVLGSLNWEMRNPIFPWTPRYVRKRKIHKWLQFPRWGSHYKYLALEFCTLFYDLHFCCNMWQWAYLKVADPIKKCFSLAAAVALHPLLRGYLIPNFSFHEVHYISWTCSCHHLFVKLLSVFVLPSVVLNGGEKCWILKSTHRLENSHTALGICGIAYSKYCCASVAGKGEFKDTKLIWKGDRWWGEVRWDFTLLIAL